MGSNEIPTILVIGLSGAGLKAFKLLIHQLYPTTQCGKPKPSSPRIRLIAIEKSRYAYWPPGSLRASVVDGFEEKVVRSFDHLIPLKLQHAYPDLIKLITGREILDLDLSNRLATIDKPLDEFGIEAGHRLSFDYLIIASGSSYAFPCRPPSDAETPESLKLRLRELQEQIAQSNSILIVGAGVVGIELAGEISSQHKQKSITLISSTPTLLPDWNKKLASSLEQQLKDRKVDIIYGSKANLKDLGITKTGKLEKLTQVQLLPTHGPTDRSHVEADFVFLAIGNQPNTKFIPGDYLNPENRLIKVNENLQVIDRDSKPIPGIYALGDAIDFQESKLYAALDGQAATVSKNLLIDIHQSESTKVIHKPLKDTIAVPLGPCGGASEIAGYTFGLGPLATSLAKGLTLFIWMFKSMYPDKSH